MSSLGCVSFGVWHKPRPEYKPRHNIWMPLLQLKSPAREVLAANLKKLRAHQPMGGLRAWSRKVKVGEATLDRMLKGSAAVQLDSIEAVARGFGLQAWQLLVPGLDPKNPPVYLSAAERDMYNRFRRLTEEIRKD